MSYDRRNKHRHSSRDRKRHHSPEKHENKRRKPPKTPEEYKHDLRRYLEDHCEVRQPEDFWKFREKYKTISSKTNYDFDKSKLLNQTFQLSIDELFERLPVLDRNGEKFNLSKVDFEEFIHTVKVYQDFQQKSKFTRLKKLRKAQRELPIGEYRNEILERLKTCRVMLIAGDTGCGKSTQIPQYVMQAGYEKIVCTQPRRIACISLAKRVAFETLSDYKNTIGYQIRFEKTKRKDTRIVFMTEGLLLRQASEDDVINSYDVIILDEVHERHLHGDFLVGIMKCFLRQNEKFKLILMSATINLKLFVDYFSDEELAVVQVPGRLYPIEIHYKPIVKDPYDKNKDGKLDCTPYLQILQMIDEKYPATEKGDLLIFLNGFSEISMLSEVLREYASHKNNWIILSLHSTLSLEEQDKVFDFPPDGVRKCIISTNIAETSVTIDGIRFVIDSGKVNRMSYVSEGGINRLSECSISQDSARQRMGRAGRTGPGICYRLYSEEDYKNFEAFTPAEIHLVPLEALILHMISLGLTDISNFPFLEKPSQEIVEESLEKLKFAGALRLEDNCLILTSLGDKLSKLPVDLTIGKMLIVSTVFGNVNSILACAALLSVQSPLTQTATRDSQARELRKPQESNHGDPITLLNLYKEWLAVKQKSSVHSKRETSKSWARKRCLEEQRFYETTKLLEQFREILIDAELLPKIEEEQLSSRERAMRHGELKKLKTMRHELKLKSKTQRKELKFEVFDSEKANTLDLRDIEFKITNDFNRIEKLLRESSADSYKDLTVLKFVISSGLYPQIAIEDEHNSLKTVNERLYHTKHKNYVFLRPTSIFATHPEILELHNDDVEVHPPGYFSKRPISKKHQILLYQSILKTKKIYLVNTMRMPALQTLLLLSKNIATNATLTKFVFDEFISTDVPYVGQGKALLKTALDIRKTLSGNLESKLTNGMISSIKPHDLIDEIVKFLSSEISYNIKRLLPADRKLIYIREVGIFEEATLTTAKNPFDPEFVMTESDLGGVRVSENVVYNCLNQDEWDSNLEAEIYAVEFECPSCEQKMTGLSFFRIFQHETFCEHRPKIPEQKPIETAKANSRLYACEVCRKDLMLTPVEILRHKKTCTSSN